MSKLKLPPLHTSRRPSTVKHIWLCVSSTAPETMWLEAHGETSNHYIIVIGKIMVK